MILDLGTTDYENAYRVQMEMVALRRLKEIEDTILIAEHNAVITIGRAAGSKTSDNLLLGEDALEEYGIKVLTVDRGGDITLHAPGQLVVYPIVDLKDRVKDLHLYMRALEGSIIRCLDLFGIKSFRVPHRTGVWTSPRRKIASIGIAATDWITYHGLSLNVNVDLEYFSMIRMCGLRGVQATSMQEMLRKKITLKEVKGHMVKSICETLNISDADYVA